jgi:hypothetical protein
MINGGLSIFSMDIIEWERGVRKRSELARCCRTFLHNGVLPGHTGQSQSQSGGAEISAGKTGEASASSGLADLLQQVSEILAGQMQQGDHQG